MIGAGENRFKVSRPNHQKCVRVVEIPFENVPVLIKDLENIAKKYDNKVPDRFNNKEQTEAEILLASKKYGNDIILKPHRFFSRASLDSFLYFLKEDYKFTKNGIPMYRVISDSPFESTIDFLTPISARLYINECDERKSVSIFVSIYAKTSKGGVEIPPYISP